MDLNELSWLIYFAKVLGEVASISFMIFSLLVIAILVFAIIWALNAFGCDSEDEDAQNRSAKALKTIKTLARISVIVGIVGIFIPGERTVYLIAASEMGEQVLSTDTAIKLKKIIDYKLDEIIAQEEPSKQIEEH